MIVDPFSEFFIKEDFAAANAKRATTLILVANKVPGFLDQYAEEIFR